MDRWRRAPPFVHKLTLASSRMKLHCLRCTRTHTFFFFLQSIIFPHHHHHHQKVSLLFQVKAIQPFSPLGFASINLRLSGCAGGDGTAVNNKQLFPPNLLGFKLANMAGVVQCSHDHRTERAASGVNVPHTEHAHIRSHFATKLHNKIPNNNNNINNNMIN